jgi:hypothetical protein
MHIVSVCITCVYRVCAQCVCVQGVYVCVV